MKALEEHGLPTFGFAHYGEKRDVDATDEKQKDKYIKVFLKIA